MGFLTIWDFQYMGFLIHGPGGAVKLYFSVPVGMYTVFFRPGSTVHCILGTKNPGQNPGQKPGQKYARNLILVN